MPRVLAKQRLVFLTQAWWESHTRRSRANFVRHVVEIFAWHPTLPRHNRTNHRLASTHPLVADIVCFCVPHINT